VFHYANPLFIIEMSFLFYAHFYRNAITAQNKSWAYTKEFMGAGRECGMDSSGSGQ
jgi:hypothetical protein